MSHTCCCGDSLYHNHIVLIDDNNKLQSIEPYTHEIAHTAFVDGCLLIVDASLESVEQEFTSELLNTLSQPHPPTIPCAILDNTIYNSHLAHMASPCAIYSITPIDNTTLLPIPGSQVTIKRIV